MGGLTPPENAGLVSTALLDENMDSASRSNTAQLRM